ncbi:MAG TPA: hypothetical protein VJH65_02080 [Candidatus Nanoarchaeia archaeon]|nr:hypothetical protein [Candidatus Nanoarchaeia archaeon]
MEKIKQIFNKKNQAIMMLVTAGLILINIPLIDEKIIAFLIALALGIYNLTE